jgi:hypothetical protein
MLTGQDNQKEASAGMEQLPALLGSQFLVVRDVVERITRASS